jgi:hypothetical protein
MGEEGTSAWDDEIEGATPSEMTMKEGVGSWGGI